jgi:hypothetical protein
MRNPDLRHVVKLRFTLLGTGPSVWREAWVDRELTLATLKEGTRALFGGPECRHHVFAEDLDHAGWSPQRRRWGDRWTMIDFRDPTVVDESTARVAHVFRDESIVFAHTCNSDWAVAIESGVSDIVAASTGPFRVAEGEGIEPFACSRGPFEREVLLGILADPSHALHEDLRERLAWTVGPWGSYAPDVVDLDAAQRRIDAALTGLVPAEQVVPTALDHVVQALPRLARPGVRAHIDDAGLHLPPVVTEDEAERLTRGFRWILGRAGATGIPMIDGAVDPDAVREGSAALSCTEAHVRALFAAARRMRLMYVRSRRLVVKKSFLSASGSATELWSLLAESLRLCGAGWRAADLLLLAIADGSLSDPAIGLDRVARALVLAGRHDRGAWGPYGNRGYSDADDDCDARCDCPPIDGSTWHDVVAQAIQDAATAASTEGARTVASLAEYGDLRSAAVRADWVGLDSPPTWRAGALRRASTDSVVSADEAQAVMLREADELIGVLNLLGLERADDGSWLVSSALREFARAALRPRTAPRHGHGSGLGGGLW